MDNTIYINNKRGAMCSTRTIKGNYNVIYGNDNVVYGNGNVVNGSRNLAYGENNRCINPHSAASGIDVRRFTSQQQMEDEFHFQGLVVDDIDETEKNHRNYLEHTLGAALRDNDLFELRKIVVRKTDWKARAKEIQLLLIDAFIRDPSAMAPTFTSEFHIVKWMEGSCDAYEAHLQKPSEEEKSHREFLEKVLGAALSDGPYKERMVSIARQQDLSWQDRATEILSIIREAVDNGACPKFTTKARAMGWGCKQYEDYEHLFDEWKRQREPAEEQRHREFLRTVMGAVVPVRYTDRLELLINEDFPWQSRALDIQNMIIEAFLEDSYSMPNFFSVNAIRQWATDRIRNYAARCKDDPHPHDDDAEFLKTSLGDLFPKFQRDECHRLVHAKKPWQERAHDVINFCVLRQSRDQRLAQFREKCGQNNRFFEAIASHDKFLETSFRAWIPERFLNEFMTIIQAHHRHWQERADDVIDLCVLKLGASIYDCRRSLRAHCIAAGRQFDDHVQLLQNAFAPIIHSTYRPRFDSIVNARKHFSQLVVDVIEFCVNTFHLDRVQMVNRFNDECKRAGCQYRMIKYVPPMILGRDLGYAPSLAPASFPPLPLIPSQDASSPPSPLLPSQEDCAHDVMLPDDALEETKSCIVCLDRMPICVVLPCFHKCICCTCARSLTKHECPTCRVAIIQISRVFE